MKRINIVDLKENVGRSVLVGGWLYDSRDLGKIRFILVRDITGEIQITGIKGKVKDAVFKLMNEVSRESVVMISGKVKESNQAPGGIEIEPEEIEIISRAEDLLPIDVLDYGKTTIDKRLDWRCLSLRSKRSKAIFKIQASIVEGMQDWLDKNGYLQVFTPCLMGVPSESGSEVFEVKYFKTKSFLRQDPQLHRQLTIAGGIEKLYDIGPSWRAEKSNTVRHLTEHRTCAVELAFIDSEQDTMRVEEQVVISAFKKVNEKCSGELKELGVDMKVPKVPFPEIKFPEVYDIMKKMGKKIKEGDDLDTDAERVLWEYVQKKYPGAEFYFLNGFPFKKKPFYVYTDGNYARSVDLYYKGLELSSGGQREHRYDKVMKNVKEKGMDSKSVEWFTKFFKYGVPTHGGFALGIERITMMLLGIENVRDVVLFPRDPGRLVP